MDSKRKVFGQLYNEFLDKFTQILSYGVLVMLVILLYEVTARYFFHSPTIWAHEVSVYLFGAMAVLAGPYLLKTDNHIRVDLIYSFYPQKVRYILDIVANVVCIVWCTMYVYFGLPLLMETLKYNEKSITPLRAPQWPIRATVPIAGILVIIQALILIVGTFQKMKHYKENTEEETNDNEIKDEVGEEEALS